MTEPNTTLPLRQRIAKAIADDGRAQADAYDPSVQYVSLDFRAGYAAATARAVEVVSEVDDGLLAADAAELALFRERDALTRKALKAEGDGPLQFLALHVRQQRDRATAERDEARARLRGMARRASMLRRSREKWRRLAGKQTHERVHDMAASMASNGQLRAENRRVKAERDEALVALAKQQAVLAQAISGDQLTRLHRYARDLQDAEPDISGDDNMSTEDAYNRGYADADVATGKALAALLDVKFNAVLDSPEFRAVLTNESFISSRWSEGDIALDHTNFVHRRFEHGWRVIGRDCGVQYDDESMETALGPMVRLTSVPDEVDVVGSVPIAVAERLRAEAARTGGVQR